MAMSILSPADFAPIDLARIELTLEMLEPVAFPAFPGPALRGMIGQALHTVSCDPDGGPAFPGPCAFHELFEGRRHAEKGQDTGPPFVLTLEPLAGDCLGVGDPLHLGLTLFGQALSFVPTLLWTLFRAGLLGCLGPRRVRFLLREAYCETAVGPCILFRSDGGPVPAVWPEAWTWSVAELLRWRLNQLPAHPEQLEVVLTSPLDLREGGRPVSKISFQSLIRSLLRNASAHARQHCGQALDLPFREVKEAAAAVRLDRDETRGHLVTHASTRQGRTIRLRTRVGRLEFRGEVGAFLPLLVLGELIQVGKGRNMGFGGMAVRVGG